MSGPPHGYYGGGQPPSDPYHGQAPGYNQPPSDPYFGGAPGDPYWGQRPADPYAPPPPAEPWYGQQPTDPYAGSQPPQAPPPYPGYPYGPPSQGYWQGPPPARSGGRSGVGAVIVGIFLVLLGLWFLFRDEIALDIGLWWPTVAVVLGVLMVIAAFIPRRSS